MPQPIKKPKAQKPKHALRVIKGGYTPADSGVAAKLRGRHRIGDIVFVTFTKPRNPKFNRYVHAFGKIISENVQGFEGLDSHSVLKRLQVEHSIACEEIQIVMPGIGPCIYRIPMSLSFESMDEVALIRNRKSTGIMAGLCSLTRL